MKKKNLKLKPNMLLLPVCLPLDTRSKNSSTSNKEPFIPLKLPQCFSSPLKSLHAFGNIFADYIALETLMMMSSHWRACCLERFILFDAVSFFGFLFKQPPAMRRDEEAEQT